MLKTVKVLKCLKETEVTIEGMMYEEYFDKPGYYYPIGPHLKLPPNGIGLPLTVDPQRSWIKPGLMEFVKEIPTVESKWWRHVQPGYDAVTEELKRQVEAMNKIIELRESNRPLMSK